jgi:hypothetical protein
MRLSFESGTGTDEAAAIIAAVEAHVRERYPVIRRLFIDVEEAKPR